MSRITYRQVRDSYVSVLLDGRVVGHIVWEYSREDAKARWIYQPKGAGLGGRGQPMDTLAAVKRSLEAA